MFRETLWGFLKLSYVFARFSAFWTKTFRTVSWIFPSRFSKLLSTCPAKHWEIFFERENLELYQVFLRPLGWKFLDFCGTVFVSVVKTAFYVCREKIEKKYFLSNDNFFSNFSDFQHKMFCRVVTTACYMSRATYWGKKFFLINFFLYFLSAFVRKTFCTVSESFLSALCKLHSRWPVEILEKQYVFWDILAFHKVFSHFQRKLSVELSAKVFRRTISESFWSGLSEHHSRCPEKNFGEIFFFESEIRFLEGSFRTLRWNFWDFWWNCSSRLSKLHSTCPAEHFEKKCFHRKDFFSKSYDFQHKNFRRVVRTPCYISRATIWKSYFRWKKLIF